MARWLWSTGAALVAIGLTAHLFGWGALLWVWDVLFWIWDALLWTSAAAFEAIRSDPATYGVVALGVALMVLARLIGRRRG